MVPPSTQPTSPLQARQGDPERMLEFLEGLIGEDFPTDPMRLTAALKLASERMLASGGVPEDLVDRLVPLFCRNPSQRRFFLELYDRWFPPLLPQAPTVPDDPKETQDSASSGTPPSSIAPAHANVKKRLMLCKGNRFCLGLLLILAFLPTIWLSDKSYEHVLMPPYTGTVLPQRDELPWLPDLGWLLVLPPLVPMLWENFLTWRKRRQGLHRGQQKGLRERTIVPVEAEDAELLSEGKLGQALLRMVGHRWIPGVKLDEAATVQATIEAGGLPVLIKRPLPETPFLLMVIEDRGIRDHFAPLAYLLARRLQRLDRTVSVWSFQGDPNGPYQPENGGASLSLQGLREEMGNRSLIMAGTGTGFFHPLTGAPQGLFKVFESWSERLLLTPYPRSRWGAWERIMVKEGFGLAYLDAQGIAEAGQWLAEGAHGGVGTLPQRMQPDSLPAVLATWSNRWLISIGPSPETSHQLLVLLKRYLGPFCYLWLAACAVYPDLRWPLTLYLGNALAHNMVVAEADLLKLLRLPWFRAGQMPEWLRSALIDDLPRLERLRIRKLLTDLLVREGTALNVQTVAGYREFKLLWEHAPGMITTPKGATQTVLSRRSMRGDLLMTAFMEGGENSPARFHLPWASPRWQTPLAWVVRGLVGGELVLVGWPWMERLQDFLSRHLAPWVGGLLAEAVTLVLLLVAAWITTLPLLEWMRRQTPEQRSFRGGFTYTVVDEFRRRLVWLGDWRKRISRAKHSVGRFQADGHIRFAIVVAAPDKDEREQETAAFAAALKRVGQPSGHVSRTDPPLPLEILAGPEINQISGRKNDSKLDKARWLLKATGADLALVGPLVRGKSVPLYVYAGKGLEGQAGMDIGHTYPIPEGMNEIALWDWQAMRILSEVISHMTGRMNPATQEMEGDEHPKKDARRDFFLKTKRLSDAVTDVWPSTFQWPLDLALARMGWWMNERKHSRERLIRAAEGFQRCMMHWNGGDLPRFWDLCLKHMIQSLMNILNTQGKDDVTSNDVFEAVVGVLLAWGRVLEVHGQNGDTTKERARFHTVRRILYVLGRRKEGMTYRKELSNVVYHRDDHKRWMISLEDAFAMDFGVILEPRPPGGDMVTETAPKVGNKRAPSAKEEKAREVREVPIPREDGQEDKSFDPRPALNKSHEFGHLLKMIGRVEQISPLWEALERHVEGPMPHQPMAFILYGNSEQRPQDFFEHLLMEGPWGRPPKLGEMVQAAWRSGETPEIFTPPSDIILENTSREILKKTWLEYCRRLSPDHDVGLILRPEQLQALLDSRNRPIIFGFALPLNKPVKGLISWLKIWSTIQSNDRNQPLIALFMLMGEEGRYNSKAYWRRFKKNIRRWDPEYMPELLPDLVSISFTDARIWAKDVMKILPDLPLLERFLETLYDDHDFLPIPMEQLHQALLQAFVDGDLQESATGEKSFSDQSPQSQEAPSIEKRMGSRELEHLDKALAQTLGSVINGPPPKDEVETSTTGADQPEEGEQTEGLTDLLDFVGGPGQKELFFLVVSATPYPHGSPLDTPARSPLAQDLFSEIAQVVNDHGGFSIRAIRALTLGVFLSIDGANALRCALALRSYSQDRVLDIRVHWEPTEATLEHGLTGSGIEHVIKLAAWSPVPGPVSVTDIALQKVERTEGPNRFLCESHNERVVNLAGMNTRLHVLLEERIVPKNLEPIDVAAKIGRARILWVEDTWELVILGREVLSKYGIDPHFASNGPEGMSRALEGGPWHCVLTGIKMPGFDGYELARGLRSKWPENELPIIAVTAENFSDTRKKCLAVGMNDHIAKPFIFPGIFHILMKWIRWTPDLGMDKAELDAWRQKAQDQKVAEKKREGERRMGLMFNQVQFSTRLASDWEKLAMVLDMMHPSFIREIATQPGQEGLHLLKRLNQSDRLHELSQALVTINREDLLYLLEPLELLPEDQTEPGLKAVAEEDTPP